MRNATLLQLLAHACAGGALAFATFAVVILLALTGQSATSHVQSQDYVHQTFTKPAPYWR